MTNFVNIRPNPTVPVGQILPVPECQLAKSNCQSRVPVWDGKVVAAHNTWVPYWTMLRVWKDISFSHAKDGSFANTSKSIMRLQRRYYEAQKVTLLSTIGIEP